MTEQTQGTVRSTDYRIDAVLLRRIWRLSRPYWLRRGSWSAWAALTATLLLMLAGAAASAWASYWMKDLTNALIARNWGGFVRNLTGFIALHCTVILALQPLGATITNWLNWDWRGWLTQYLADGYLAHRSYYDIALQGDLDNPDQRLQESSILFVKNVLGLPLTLFGQIGTILAGVAVIVVLDRNLLFAAIGLATVQILANYVAVIPYVRLNAKTLVAEANLRFSLVRLREHAEPIAFYHGEGIEREQLGRRVGDAVQRQRSMGYYDVVLNRMMPGFFSFAWTFLPLLVLGPRVVGGHLTYGAVAQATVLTGQIMLSVTMLASFLTELGLAAPHAVRLAALQERLDAVRAERGLPDAARIAIIRGRDRIRLDDVTVDTPDGSRRLIERLSFEIDRGASLAILGQTGVGKSSLLRVMAGLWDRGAGCLEMPDPAQCLFLPQRPYMTATDLRSQLLYPHHVPASDQLLRDVLAAVDLPHLVENGANLSAVRDWERILSLGEQQRIAFARILVSRPSFVFLDEATSAVDHATEARLYNMLRETGATFVSIGHRLTILDYHTRILTLRAGGRWTLESHDKCLATTIDKQ